MPARKKPMHELAGGGDGGTTGLLGGGRASKDDLRLEAYGSVDEASSALGLAKALSSSGRVKEITEELQRGLYRLGAELATNPDGRARFATTTAADVESLVRLLRELESVTAMPEGFILPGTTAASGAFDLARTVVRRAERRCVTLAHQGSLENAEVLRYLNRMSLVVFVLARFEEAAAGAVPAPAKGAEETQVSPAGPPSSEGGYSPLAGPGEVLPPSHPPA